MATPNSDSEEDRFSVSREEIAIVAAIRKDLQTLTGTITGSFSPDQLSVVSPSLSYLSPGSKNITPEGFHADKETQIFILWSAVAGVGEHEANALATSLEDILDLIEDKGNTFTSSDGDDSSSMIPRHIEALKMLELPGVDWDANEGCMDAQMWGLREFAKLSGTNGFHEGRFFMEQDGSETSVTEPDARQGTILITRENATAAEAAMVDLRRQMALLSEFVIRV